MNDFPSFAEFYSASNADGFAPLPWQDRLADQVAADGRWPSDIGVPTGLGKTSCLDIAVWSLAKAAAGHGPARVAPTRIWYVVNRRLLVDAALERARELQELLRDPPAEPVAAVADALAAMQGTRWDFGPLHVGRLRGGVARDHRPPDPSCPSIVLSTVPMFGSRLLFRGYGVSSGMRPIDAALAGTDSLVLLDEAHLAFPLQKLLDQLEELPEPAQEVLPRHRGTVSLVNLTATGAQQAFTLDDCDHQHPLVRQRLDAAKPTKLVESRGAKAVTTLATEAVDLLGDLVDGGVAGPAIVVFVNTARQAPVVRAELGKVLRKQKAEADVTVLTGRLRPTDASRVRKRLMGGELDVRSGRPTDDQRSKPLFVVATQTLEVGADFDFDGLVTESAGVRALTQRFGRLNRLGTRNHARAAIVHTSDPKRGEWPVYGAEPGEVWSRLRRAAETPLDVEPRAEWCAVDLGPGRIGELLGPAADVPPPSPELLPNFVWEWAKTSLPGRREVPVEPFFSGEEEDDYSVSLMWRCSLPTSTARLVPAPHSDEVVDVPIGEVRAWLDTGDEADTVWVFNPDDGTVAKLPVGELRPGVVVVLPADRGGYLADGGWDPDSEATVDDLSGELRDELVLSTSLLEEFPVPDEVARLADEAQAVHTGGLWHPLPGRSEVSGGEDVVDDLVVALADVDLKPWSLDDPVPGRPLVLRRESPPKRTPAPRVDSEEELSLGLRLDGNRAELAVHLDNVGVLSATFARKVGLSEPLVEAVGLAGRLHDWGKADPRFQLLLGRGDGELLAKSEHDGQGQRGIWPVGGRHEAISGMLVDAWLAQGGPGAARSDPAIDLDIDLVRHLVLSHHGHGRPLVPSVEGGGSVSVAADVEGVAVSVEADLSQVDWSQPARFERLCRRYGYWGLALLETLLRQADHTESSQQRGVRLPIGVS